MADTNLGNATPEEKRRTTAAIFRRDGDCCVYCAARSPLSVDHIVTRSVGGSWRPDNLLTACRPCNNLRGDMTLAEFVGEERAAELILQAQKPLPDVHLAVPAQDGRCTEGTGPRLSCGCARCHDARKAGAFG
jgi:hypothetical protein